MNKIKNFSVILVSLFAILMLCLGMTFGTLTLPEVAHAEATDVTTETYVAQIGETQYATLSAAISAANAGDTVKLVADLTIEAPIEIAADADLTLDFNGFTATYNGNGTGTRPFQICGNLTVNNGTANSREEGQGGVTVTDRLCWGVFDQRGGTLIVNGGYFRSCGYDSGSILRVREGAVETIVNNGSFVVQGFDQMAYDGAFYNDGFGKVTINDGYFFTTSDNTGKDTTGVGNWYYCVQSKNGMFIVNGGTIIGCQGALAVAGGDAVINNVVAETKEDLASGQTGRSFYALYVAGAEREVTCVVNGGTFTSANRAAAYIGNSTPGDGGICADALITIKGGTFSSNGTGAALAVDGVVGTASVEGGKFSTLPNAKYLANETLFAQGADGYEAITYEEAVNSNIVAVVNGVGYNNVNDFVAAVNAAPADSTVKLLHDVTLNKTIVILNKLTFDLNGHNITHDGDRIKIGNLAKGSDGAIQVIRAEAEVIITNSSSTESTITVDGSYGNKIALFPISVNSLQVNNVNISGGQFGVFIYQTPVGAVFTDVNISNAQIAGIYNCSQSATKYVNCTIESNYIGVNNESSGVQRLLDAL